MVGFSVATYKEVPIIPIQQFRPESCMECKFRDMQSMIYSVCSRTGRLIKHNFYDPGVDKYCPLKSKENEMNSEW